MENIPTFLTEVFTLVLQPEILIQAGGLLLVMLIIFAETGLFFGFFLPGDSLLFTAGLLTATGIIDQSIVLVLGCIILAAIAGDFVGYWFGRKVGLSLYQRPDSLLFRKNHLRKAQIFYRKNGKLALVAGRFLPVIRTFAPIVAGMIRIDFKKFVNLNIVGAVLWTLLMVLPGYFLGKTLPQAQQYLEYIIVSFIFVSLMPMLSSFWKRRKMAEIKFNRSC